MNRTARFLSIAAFALLALPAIASAQYGGYGYPNGGNGYPNGGYGNGGYGNGGYGNNGRYGSYGNNGAIRSLKDKTREFQRQLDQDLDNGRYNGSRREDEMNQVARDFRNAVNRLDNNGRDYNDIQRVQQLGYEVDRVIGRARVSYQTQNLWQSIRYDLQQLGYSNGRSNGGRNNGGWGNGRGNNNGSWGNGRPSWWPF